MSRDCGASRLREEPRGMKRADVVVLALSLVVFYGCGTTTRSTELHYNAGADVECSEERPSKGKVETTRLNACWKWSHSAAYLTGACLIDSNRTLHCWRKSLAAVPAGRYTTLDEDGYSACALTDTGQAVCWGGQSEWKNTPTVKLTSVVVGSDSSAIFPPVESVRAFACGIREDGIALCWEAGSLGRTSVLDGKFAMLSASMNKMCGVLTTGALRCYGATVVADSNQLISRVSLGADSVCVTYRNDVTKCKTNHLSFAITGAVAVRTGAQHVCILHAGGRVECAGNYRPFPAIRVSYLGEPTSFDNYCAISTDQTVYCWGDPNSEPSVSSEIGTLRPSAVSTQSPR
jgi:hypothetical protein